MVAKDFYFVFSWLQMVNRLTKSAEMQVRVDDEYFRINMEGHHMRLKWENTLKNCYQVCKNALQLIILWEFSVLLSRVAFCEWTGSFSISLKNTQFVIRAEPVSFREQKII